MPIASPDRHGRLPSRRALCILFSHKRDWEPLLRDAFRDTPHSLTYDTFTTANLVTHDIVVPLTIADLKLLCGTRAGTRDLLPVPSLRSVEICDDKLLFNRALVDAGLGRYVPPFGATPFYPYILKRRIDEHGRHSYIIGSWAHEQSLDGRLAAPDYFRQELVPGRQEYATHIVFDRGRIIYALTIEYVFASDIHVKGREPCMRVAPVANPACLGVFSKVLDTLAFRGLCCVNYKLVDGQPLIFEVNPRFGHSLCAHFPRLLERLLPSWGGRLAGVFFPRPINA